VALCTAPEARGGAGAGGDTGADVDVYVTEFPFPDRALEARLTFAPAFADAVGARRMSEVRPPLSYPMAPTTWCQNGSNDIVPETRRV
jgi:hypothetical protein